MPTAIEPAKPFEASEERIRSILSVVEDEELRDDVAEVVRLSLCALGSLSRIHLPQDHFEEGDNKKDDDKHLELAPYVLRALGSINEVLGFVSERFPAPEASEAEQTDDDFDLEFDLVDGPTGEGTGLSHHAREDGSDLTPREQVADALYAFGSMLRSRVLDFGKRLSFAVQQESRWPLLNELDDASHRLTKAVQGVLFGVLGNFAGDVRREEILPAYRSAVDEAVALRKAISELTHHINRFNAAIAEASPEEAIPLVVAVADRLARFATQREYRTLRAEDKKAVIDFRSSLYDLRHRKDGLPMLELRRAVEGFSKFLEAMGAINHREALVLHDRKLLEQVLERLEGALSAGQLGPTEALASLRAVADELDGVKGRNPELDDTLRGYAREGLPQGPAAISELMRLRGLLQMSLSMVG